MLLDLLCLFVIYFVCLGLSAYLNFEISFLLALCALTSEFHVYLVRRCLCLSSLTCLSPITRVPGQYLDYTLIDVYFALSSCKLLFVWFAPFLGIKLKPHLCIYLFLRITFTYASRQTQSSILFLSTVKKYERFVSIRVF